MFLLIFFIFGVIYSFGANIFLSIKNFYKFKKEFSKQFSKKRRLFLSVLSFGIIVMLFGFYEKLFFPFGILIFVLPYLYLYAKSVDESCMIKKIQTSKLTEGDWLYHDLKIGKKIIKANWDGLTKKNISLIKKRYNFVRIRQGIPFAPTFLISFIILCILYFLGLEKFIF